MRKHVALIQGHPDVSPDRLCRALADAYIDGARTSGHIVEEIDVARLDFPLLRRQKEFEDGAMPAALDKAAEAIREAEHVVFVFPLWLGTMPALLKAFLEQIMRPGFAFDYDGGGFPKKLLKGRSARIIVTMGMPSSIYRWVYLDHGLAGLRRSILGFVGLSPVRETLFGRVNDVPPEVRRQWLTTIAGLGRQAR